MTNNTLIVKKYMRLPTTNPNHKIRCMAYQYIGYGLSIVELGESNYSITHTLSGIGVYFAHSLEIAQKWLYRLASGINWGVPHITPEMAEKAINIINQEYVYNQ